MHICSVCVSYFVCVGSEVRFKEKRKGTYDLMGERFLREPIRNDSC